MSTITLQRILVPTDLSDFAGSALRWTTERVIRFAKRPVLVMVALAGT